MDNFFLLAPPVALLIFMVVGWVLYRWGDSIAPKPAPSREKELSYACGLDVPEGKPRPNYNLFHVAFIFTVFHVLILMALMLATVQMTEGTAILGTCYLLTALVAIYAVISR